MCRNGYRHSLICDADGANRAIGVRAVFMGTIRLIYSTSIVADAFFDSRSGGTVKRFAGRALLALAMFALAACEEEEETVAVAPTDRAYEQSLIDAGLRPLDREGATALLNDATVYASYALTGQKRVEYFDSGGVVVLSDVADAPAAPTAERELLFGSWWAEGDQTCFAYGSSEFVECYRLYYREGSLLFIPIVSSSQVPAGALLAYSTEIRKGNSERFPLLGH